MGGFFLLAIILPAAVTFYTDWLWFGEMGYQDVFVRTLTAQGTLGVAAMAVAFGVLLVNLRIAMRTISPRQVVVHTREGPLAIAIDRRRMQPLGTAVAAGLAVLFGLFGSGQWQEWLLFRSRPAVRRRGSCARQGRQLLCLPAALPGCCSAGICSRWSLLAGVIAGAVYVLAGAIDLDLNRGPRIARPARRHLAALAAALLLVLAFDAYLDVPRLLTSPAASSTAPRTSMWPSGFRRCAP